MPREPELSIKVNVDPHVDPQQTRDTIQRKFNDIKNPPTVTIKPDLSKFDSFIKDDLGGDYSVDITPNIAGDIKGKIKEEIDKAVKSPDFPKVPLKVDVGDFSNELSSALKKELKDVNDKLSYYLKNLTKNSDNLTGLVNDLLPTKNISAAGAKLSKEVSKTVNDATDAAKKSVKPLTIDDLLNYKSKTTLTSIQKVKDSILQLKNSLTDLYTDEKYIDEDEQIVDVKGFQEKLRILKSESKDLKKVLEGFSSTIGMKSISSAFNNKDFNIEKTCSDLLELINVLDLISETPIFKNKSEAQDFSERLYANVGKYSSSLDTLCDSTIANLDKVSERSKEVIHEQDVLQRTQAQVEKRVESTKKEDSSGLLDSSSIKQYADSIDEALSQVSTKYEEINKKRKSAINLESTLLSKVKLNKESLKDELKEYSDILKNFDDSKLKGIADRAAAIQDSNVPVGDKKKPKETPKSKPKSPPTTFVPNFPGAPNNKNESQSLVNDGIATIKKVVFDVKQEDLQSSIDTLFAKVSAPIGFRPAEKAIESVRTELTNALKNIDFTLTVGKQNVNGETTTTATTISESQSTSDLKKQATSIGSIKRNLEVVTTGIDKYMTDIASVGTAFEYSMSQVDALNKALENQIVDFNTLDNRIEDYINKTNELHPIELSGRINVELDDIIVPKKIPLNGELEITNATKEIKEATRKAQPKQPVTKQKNVLTDRDFERKSKELLTSLASIMKGKARVQNSLTTHTRKGQSEAAAEDSYYLSKLSRRERTTKGKLTKLYKGRGGRSTWQSSSIYHSAIEDSEHIRNSRVAENSDKDKAAEEEKYIAALRQRPKLYKEIAAARREYGNDSEYVKSAQKELQETLGTINQFESKIGKQYLQSMPERRKVFAENMSNLRKDRDDVQRDRTHAAVKDHQKATIAAEKTANKEREDSEKEFLANLAKEPKLWADAEKARKEYGDNSAEAKQAKYLRDKNQSAIKNFKSNYSGSLSDIHGYDDQVKENNFAMAAYQSGMTRKANNEQQKQHDANQAAFQKRREDMAKQTAAVQKKDIKSINDAKKKYLDAYDAIQQKREELLKIDDVATKQMIQNAIVVQRGIMKSAGNEINSYGKNHGNLVSDTWNEISVHRNNSQIKDQSAYEIKSSKEAAATKKENIDLLKQYNQSLNEELKLLKQVYAAETAEDKAAAQNALNDQKDKTENLRNQLKGKGLDSTSEYQKYNTQNSLNKAALKAKYNGVSIEDLKNTYIKNLRDREANINAAYSTEDADIIARITQRIEDNNQAIREAGIGLAQFGQKANDAWAEISKVNDELDIAAEQRFNKAIESQAKEAQKNLSDDEKLLNRIERTMRNREKAYDSWISADDGTKDAEAKHGRFNIQSARLNDLVQEASARGLTSTQQYLNLQDQHVKELGSIKEAQQKRAEAEQEAIRVQDEDRISLLNYIKTVEKYKGALEKDNNTDASVYGDSVNIANAGWNLLSELNKSPDDKDQVAYLWGQKYGIQGVTDLESAFKALAVEAAKAGIKVQNLRTETEKLRAETQARTNIANLQSQLSDYLEKFPKVSSGLSDEVRKLQDALADPSAYKNVGKLKQTMAELRAQAKALGLESESLFDKFEKLFGQHLSTMITMAALHKMQDALRIVYQNVVEINTAVTELRKVSEYAGKSLEEYMSRASEQAQKLGVSISDYVNSTADWKRLGYSDEDAENMATYSTLLKNVGDGIDDVNTSSSYLISTLQGFGLLADQAEDVVNKIDAVANTQPVTAKDLGEILTRSSAAMSSANNTLEETIALGTAANAVIQDADTVGTTLKSLSMYLRAAKSDAENAGIEVDGMANSVSELRSELKSLTGVDIMLDSKNFKSTYQIMKELSQVWSGLSDVTQANVTEMIGGKRNANAVSAILNNFDVAESSMESAANSANVAWAENEKYLDSIQGRLAQLDASFQALSTDVLDSDLVKTVVSLATGLTKAANAMIKFTGAIPMGAGIATFVTQLGKPKMTGFTIVPSNTPGGDTEQARCIIYWCSAAREYLVKPTNMAA